MIKSNSGSNFTLGTEFLKQVATTRAVKRSALKRQLKSGWRPSGGFITAWYKEPTAYRRSSVKWSTDSSNSHIRIGCMLFTGDNFEKLRKWALR